MSNHELFEQTLRKMIAGELPVKWDFNEFVGHADVVRQLLEVAPDEIRDDLAFLHTLMADARDTTGSAVLGIFPRLTNPELAGVEGRISDYIAEHCGIRYGDPEYVVGRTIGESRCPAWPGVGTPMTNNRFPYLIDTSASNYFSNRFWQGDGCPPGFISVPEGGKVVFKGEYPHARYFAFHPSDFDTNNLDTIVDVDLEPDEGSVNPYREAQPEGVGRRFTAQLVFTEKPANPEPNTTYAGVKVNGGRNPAVFCIYRTTGSDFGTMPPNIGGVWVPSVTVYDADGNETTHFDEMDPHPEGSEPPHETTRFAPLPIPDHRGLCWPEKYSTKSNWGLPYDILASADILYLVTPYTDRLGKVHVTRGKKFKAPNTPEEPAYTPGNDIRGFTVTTYNFWAGICEDAVVDRDVPVDEDGFYTIVVSSKEDRPSNATAENGVTWLDWGTYLDGQLTFRMLISREDNLRKLKTAIDTGEVAPDIAPYVPQSRHCDKEAFEEKGWKAAF
ncbi:MAG: hypothetical protein OSB60_09265 [Myxococcota bacterium]|nr:hypothetical protein [Myxococcota bacterium]